jgi:cbb3-type cytochrome oxidase subunit 3
MPVVVVVAQCSRFGAVAASLELNRDLLASPSPSPSPREPIRPADTSRDWLAIDQAVLLTIFVIVMGILLFLAVVWVYWRRKHEVVDEDDSLYSKWEAEVEDESPTEPVPPAIAELEEEEDELWLPEPYHYGEHSDGSDAPPDEEDEEDNLELVEWTGNRGETRLTRIAQGAGERGTFSLRGVVCRAVY